MALAVLMGLVVILSACGRAPTSTVPTPSIVVDSSPTPIDSPLATTSPIAGKTPIASPVATPTKVTRTTPIPTPSVAPQLKINALSFPTGELRVAYPAITFGATGGKPPYSWSGSGLPGGLGVSTGGSLTGTPGASGAFAVSIQVSDAAGASTKGSGSMTIAPYLSVSGTCSSSPCQVEAGCVTVCGNFGSQSGGVGPFKYAAQGTLPTGMGINGLNMTGPFPAGSYKFGVGVTDALGVTAFVPVAYDVFAHIQFTVKGATCSGSATKGCVTRLTYAGGTPGGTPTARIVLGTAPALPKGFKAVASAGVVSITFPASIDAKYTYSGTIGVYLVDQSLCGPAAGQLCKSATAPVTITIVAG